MTFNKTAFVQYLLARLAEPTTWIGLIGIITASGVFTVSTGLRDQIIALGVMLVGGVLTATKAP